MARISRRMTNSPACFIWHRAVGAEWGCLKRPEVRFGSNSAGNSTSGAESALPTITDIVD